MLLEMKDAEATGHQLDFVRAAVPELVPRVVHMILATLDRARNDLQRAIVLDLRGPVGQAARQALRSMEGQ